MPELEDFKFTSELCIHCASASYVRAVAYSGIMWVCLDSVCIRTGKGLFSDQVATYFTNQPRYIIDVDYIEERIQYMLQHVRQQIIQNGVESQAHCKFNLHSENTSLLREVAISCVMSC